MTMSNTGMKEKAVVRWPVVNGNCFADDKQLKDFEFE